jgi:hypothetical protein
LREKAEEGMETTSDKHLERFSCTEVGPVGWQAGGPADAMPALPVSEWLAERGTLVDQSTIIP